VETFNELCHIYIVQKELGQ